MTFDPWVFLFLTVILIGGAGLLTGQALANAWRPIWQLFLSCLLLGIADRFLVFALFGGELLSLPGFVMDAVVIVSAGLFGYRMTMARRMTEQYPWIYQRRGLFSWKEKTGGGIRRSLSDGLYRLKSGYRPRE